VNPAVIPDSLFYTLFRGDYLKSQYGDAIIYIWAVGLLAGTLLGLCGLYLTYHTTATTPCAVIMCQYHHARSEH
jgi:ABC-type multidrug transport system permease subunit